MSNYFRTLLRFEKARAAARGTDPETDDEAYELDEPPRPRRGNRRRRIEGDPLEPRSNAPRTDVRPSYRDRGETERDAEWSTRSRRDSESRRSSASRQARERSALFPPVDDERLDERPSARDDWAEFREPLNPRRRRPGLFDRLRRWTVERRDGATSTDSLLAFGQLLDSLRATDTRFSAPGVVLASAGGHASVRQVVDGLMRQARSIGVRVALAEMVLDGEERLLRSRDEAEDLPTASNLELTGSGSDQILRDWFERATAGHDLLIVEGPPLTHSVDAALLARSGDGLAIVLEPRRTSRAEFDTAIERTRASGCFVLGLVMSRHQHWLPRFLRGFFNAYPRSIRTRPRRAGRSS